MIKRFQSVVRTSLYDLEQDQIWRRLPHPVNYVFDTLELRLRSAGVYDELSYQVGRVFQFEMVLFEHFVEHRGWVATMIQYCQEQWKDLYVIIYAWFSGNMDVTEMLWRVQT